MHKQVFDRVEQWRLESIKAHNWRTSVAAPIFACGDLVLNRRSQDHGHKLLLRWFGPYRITNFYADLAYTVTDL